LPKSVLEAEIRLNSKDTPGKSQEIFMTLMFFKNLKKNIKSWDFVEMETPRERHENPYRYFWYDSYEGEKKTFLW